MWKTSFCSFRYKRTAVALFAYRGALNFCGFYYLRYLRFFHVSKIKILANIFFPKKFIPLAKSVYIQTSQVESCCCHCFKMSVSYRNKTMKWETKHSDVKKGLQERMVWRYSTEKSFYKFAQEVDVNVIEWHRSLDYRVLHLYMYFHSSIPCLLNW